MRTFVVLALVLALQTGLSGVTRRDGATINTSASTNSAGYLVRVWSDGQASVTPVGRSGNIVAVGRMARLPASTASRLLNDAKAAKQTRPQGEVCMKSASFGTTTTVAYHGYTSPDLSCPATDSTVARLSADVRLVVRAVSAEASIGRPVGLPRGEPRRAETSPSPSPRPR